MLGALAASFGTAKPNSGAKETATPEKPEVTLERGGESASEEIPMAPSPELTTPQPQLSVQATPPPLNPTPGVGCVKKTTVSFHDTEQHKVDEILDALKRSRRHRGGFSDAIKIALRLCPLDDQAIGAAWDEARAQDQRVLRHRKDS